MPRARRHGKRTAPIRKKSKVFIVIVQNFTVRSKRQKASQQRRSVANLTHEPDHPNLPIRRQFPKIETLHRMRSEFTAFYIFNRSLRCFEINLISILLNIYVILCDLYYMRHTKQINSPFTLHPGWIGRKGHHPIFHPNTLSTGMSDHQPQAGVVVGTKT